MPDGPLGLSYPEQVDAKVGDRPANLQTLRRWRWCAYGGLFVVLYLELRPTLTRAERIAIEESDDGGLVFLLEWMVQTGKALLMTILVVVVAEVLLRRLVPRRERSNPPWIPPGLD